MAWESTIAYTLPEVEPHQQLARERGIQRRVDAPACAGRFQRRRTITSLFWPAIDSQLDRGERRDRADRGDQLDRRGLHVADGDVQLQHSHLARRVHAHGALPAGNSYTQSQSVTLPVGVSGSYYFIVQTDVNGQVFQNGDTAGNIGVEASATNVNLTPPPDLTVSSVSPAVSSVLAGHTLDVTYTVANDGSSPTVMTAGANVPVAWTDSFFLSPTPTLNSEHRDRDRNVDPHRRARRRQARTPTRWPSRSPTA